jgi:hypothetical protein
MKSAVAIDTGTATAIAINAISTVPTISAAIPKCVCGIGLAGRFTVVKNLQPAASSAARDCTSRNQPISTSTTRVVMPHARQNARYTRSALVRLMATVLGSAVLGSSIVVPVASFMDVCGHSAAVPPFAAVDFPSEARMQAPGEPRVNAHRREGEQSQRRLTDEP